MWTRRAVFATQIYLLPRNPSISLSSDQFGSIIYLQFFRSMPWFKKSPEGDCDRLSFLADANLDINNKCAIWSSKSHTLFRGKPPQKSILSKSEKNSAPRLHLSSCVEKNNVLSVLARYHEKWSWGVSRRRSGPILQRNGERRRQGGGEREALRNNGRRERRQWKRRQSYKFWTSSSKASWLTFPDLGQISRKRVEIKPEGSFIHQSFVTPVFSLLEKEEKTNYAQPHVCKMPLVHY